MYIIPTLYKLLYILHREQVSNRDSKEKAKLVIAV